MPARVGAIELLKLAHPPAHIGSKESEYISSVVKEIWNQGCGGSKEVSLVWAPIESESAQ